MARASKSAAVILLLTGLTLPTVAFADPTPTQPSEINAWGQAVCNNPANPNSPAKLTRFEPRQLGLPSAITAFLCINYYPLELVGNEGSAYDLSIDIAGYFSSDGLNADLRRLANRKPVLAYATKKDTVNVWWLVVAGAFVEWKNIPAIVPNRALQTLQALRRFGFTVKSS